MAAPNYQFEKRKRELAKKAAKAEKKLRKADRDANPETPEAPVVTEGAAETPPPAET